MKKVFIAGSRKISKLTTEVKKRIDRIVEKRLPVLVGDANGADKAVQLYLCTKRYSDVEVFCSGGHCRNNWGDWPVRSVSTQAKSRSFDYYTEKDRAMADEASYGLMIWDGKSKGTLMNVIRLVNAGKAVAIYISSSKQFLELKNSHDWNEFNAAYVSRRPELSMAASSSSTDEQKHSPALF